jgi:hypothetical protein
MASEYISGLATLIYEDLSSPSDLSVSSIQSKLVNEGFLGKLNNSISSSYVIVTGDISPVLGLNEQSIYSQLYISEYYTKKINSILGGTEIAWTTVKDGDSTIIRSSQTETAKVFKDLKKQSDEELIRLIGSYRVGASGPLTVDYAPPPIQ